MRFRLPLVLAVLCAALGYAQPQGAAVSGSGISISIEELKQRYALTPRAMQGGRHGEAQAVEEFLYSVAAEKLWAREAERLGLDSSAFMRGTFRAVEQLFLRDALFRDKIARFVTVTDIELIRAFQRAKTVNRVNFLFSTDSAEAVALHHKLAAGTPFDTLLAGRDELQYQPEPLEIGYGNPDQGVERAVFALPLPGSYSAPYQDKNGWFIFFLRGRGLKKLSSSEEQKLQGEVKKQLQETKTDSIYQVFYKQFFTGKRAESDEALFERFVARVVTALRNKTEAKATPKLEAADAAALIAGFGADTLAMPFITLPGGIVSFGAFLYQFVFEGFSSHETEPAVVAAQLQARVRQFIEQEMLAREAARLGYGQRQEVKADIAMWKDYYLAAQARRAELDSLSEGTADTAAADTEYNISVIATSNLDAIRSVLAELRNGADFSVLARTVTPANQLLDSTGRSGYRSPALLGEAAAFIAGMQEGEVRGPLPCTEGFMLIKLIGKRAAATRTGLAGAEDRLRRAYMERLNRRTAELALNARLDVRLNEVLRAGLKNQQMLVMRYFGFGGTLTAFPLTLTQTGWVEEWLRRMKELP